MSEQKFSTGYMDKALFNLEKVLRRAKRDLKDVDFDTLVGTGFSSGVVIPALALRMGKKFTLIRKDNDDSHHGSGKFLGEMGDRWIFIDDFISSGRTRDRVIRKVIDWRGIGPWNPALGDYGDYEPGPPLQTEFVGQYMYAFEEPTFEAAADLGVQHLFHPDYRTDPYAY